MKLELIATATFGLEAVARREVEALGYKVLRQRTARSLISETSER